MKLWSQSGVTAMVGSLQEEPLIPPSERTPVPQNHKIGPPTASSLENQIKMRQSWGGEHQLEHWHPNSDTMWSKGASAAQTHE